MRIGRNEIIEALTEHMRKFGGEPGEWCVGVAETDSKLQIQDAGFQIQDSRETPSNMAWPAGASGRAQPCDLGRLKQGAPGSRRTRCFV
jgi:hypothetical protein